ncbi:MAG: proline--tRNA ligase [Spirochaetales bacterium]|nr:proline--tRNA ligase [Spirochaetales bacterium]
MAEKITPRSESYSDWYVDIVLNAKLADYSPVKGCMVIRPRGYALWEAIQSNLDKMFKATGHSNAYFPMLIPESFLKKEAEHVEGFSPELAVVTHAGGSELEEPLVLRPTSETIIWSMYKKWIQSYRDLPLLLNQWANVIRWEKRTRMFLRTTEFLWQEGHTAHETSEEAEEETIKMLNVYKEFAEGILAVPVLTGVKSQSEKFAGAINTYAIEAMMQDKKALQAGTSHFLGQNFAKAFDVTFQTREGKLDYVWASSWGVSTRLIGALIMTHSDDKGLVLPPKVAPQDAVLIPIYKAKNKDEVLDYADSIYKILAEKFRIVKDYDDTNSPGWKYSEWEMCGMPVRIEVGPRDMENRKAVLVRRDSGEKIFVEFDKISDTLDEILKDMQVALLEKARAYREENTFEINNYDEFLKFFNEGEGGFAESLWCGSGECEAKIKEATKATIRVLPFDRQENIEGTCVCCNKKAKNLAIFAKSY